MSPETSRKFLLSEKNPEFDKMPTTIPTIDAIVRWQRSERLKALRGQLAIEGNLNDLRRLEIAEAEPQKLT